MKKTIAILPVVAMILAGMTLFSCGKEEEKTQNKVPDAEIDMNAGLLNGKFSISATKQVCFSMGNLQYTTVGTHAVAGGGTAQGTWRFAENQWDTIGALNANASATYTGWIDLFGWGTSGYHNPDDAYNIHYLPYSTSEDSLRPDLNVYGYGPSTNMADPDMVGTSANYDWGVYNAISNGGNAPGLWRTLSFQEWYYILKHRSNAASKWGFTVVGGVRGLTLLPDEWVLPEGLTFVSGWNSNPPNEYSIEQWLKMDSAGAVFLPATGYRWEDVSEVNYFMSYWTSSHCTLYEDTAPSSAYLFELTFEPAIFEGSTARAAGLAVRLVRDCDNKTTNSKRK